MTATYIGTTNMHYTKDKVYSLQTQLMTGKRYKDRNDSIGEPDTRIMVWRNEGNPALKVYDSQADIAKE